MMKLSIGNLGGSNSIVGDSYTSFLMNDEDFEFSNKAIGATNSIYSLIQNVKYRVIENNEILIFEYFVNDCNFAVNGINNVSRVHRTIVELLRLCKESNTKLLFVLIYNFEHYSKGLYENLDVYKEYFKMIKKYDISYVDSNDLLSKSGATSLESFYRDPTHLNAKGMALLAEEVKRKIKSEDLNFVFDGDDFGFNGLSLHKVSNFFQESKRVFSNALVNLEFVELSFESLCIEFDKPTSILAVEYLCDKNSGFLEIKSTNEIIHKNTLKDEDFVLKNDKKMAAIVTFNTKSFSESRTYHFRNIGKSEVSALLLDFEKGTCTPEHSEAYFKLVSVLSTNNAEIKRAYFTQ